MFRLGNPTEVGKISIFNHKKSKGIRPYRDMHVHVLVRTGRKNLGIYPVSSPSDTGFIQFMKKIVGFNSTHPPITHIGVHSGLKKTNSTYPKPPKKGRIPALYSTLKTAVLTRSVLLECLYFLYSTPKNTRNSVIRTQKSSGIVEYDSLV
jgi:hypothetical protein